MSPAKRGAWWLAAAALTGSTWLAMAGRGAAPGGAVPAPPSARGAGTRTHDVPALPGSTVTAASSGALEATGAATSASLRPIPRDELLREGAADRSQGQSSVRRDLFAARPPTPKAALPAQAPLPVSDPTPAPPPVPKLQFAGKQLDESGWRVFLLRGEQVLIVRETQLIDNEYRVESIKPPRMTLVHVARGQPFEILIGEAP